MKKNEIIKANSILLLAISFIDLDKNSDTGHPRSSAIRAKIHKILSSFDSKKNVTLNIKANAISEKVLKDIKEHYKGKTIALEVNAVAMMLLSQLEEKINLSKLYNLPTSNIVSCINTLADITSTEVFNCSADVAEMAIAEVYDG